MGGGRDLDPRGQGPAPVRWSGNDPEEGALERSRFVALSEVLARHTRTPEETVVAFWVGYPWWPRAWSEVPQVRQPARDYCLFRRSLSEVARLCVDAPLAGWPWVIGPA